MKTLVSQPGRLTAAALLAGLATLTAVAQPNFLLILADDCTWNDLPVYGGKNARTPNIDLLSAAGLTFDRAYIAMAMCQPARSELYSGQFPLRNGSCWNHSASRPTTRSLPQILGARGYRVGIAGKTHVVPQVAFPFESVPGFDPNCVRTPTRPHQLTGIGKFMTRDANQPFCLVIALVEPHVPWVMGDPSQYPTNALQLPPNLADTPMTRECFARYLAEISYMDGQVGEILGVLQSSGLASDTLVLFSSEQGSQFPGNKWTCWETGLHTGLIARWPGHIAAGVRTDAIVQYADVAPTLVDLAGGDPNASGFDFDGMSFAELLTAKRSTHREYAHGLHNNVPEGPSYPIRTITDGRWRYVRNLAPERIYIERHLMGLPEHTPYVPTWLFTAADNVNTLRLVNRFLQRPAEELYDLSVDPYCMNNLIGVPERSEIQHRLARELDRWLVGQGDTGLALDTDETLQASKRGEHKFGSRP
jgi:uncharacterized sulfatase